MAFKVVALRITLCRERSETHLKAAYPFLVTTLPSPIYVPIKTSVPLGHRTWLQDMVDHLAMLQATVHLLIKIKIHHGVCGGLSETLNVCCSPVKYEDSPALGVR